MAFTSPTQTREREPYTASRSRARATMRGSRSNASTLSAPKELQDERSADPAAAADLEGAPPAHRAAQPEQPRRFEVPLDRGANGVVHQRVFEAVENHATRSSSWHRPVRRGRSRPARRRRSHPPGQEIRSRAGEGLPGRTPRALRGPRASTSGRPPPRVGAPCAHSFPGARRFPCARNP